LDEAAKISFATMVYRDFRSKARLLLERIEGGERAVTSTLAGSAAR
jgi:hypothetical protein